MGRLNQIRVKKESSRLHLLKILNRATPPLSLVEMSQNGATKNQVNHKVGACDQLFSAIQNLVALTNQETTASSENQIWVLKELSETWTMKSAEIKRRMKKDYGFSPSLTDKTLKALMSRGLASRIRMGVYQANFKMIFLQALRSAGYGDLAELLDQEVSS